MKNVRLFDRSAVRLYAGTNVREPTCAGEQRRRGAEAHSETRGSCRMVHRAWGTYSRTVVPSYSRTLVRSSSQPTAVPHHGRHGSEEENCKWQPSSQERE